jgi:hypothetical protein
MISKSLDLPEPPNAAATFHSSHRLFVHRPPTGSFPRIRIALPVARDLGVPQVAAHLFGAAADAAGTRPWVIETKYYTAHTQVLEFCSVVETDAPNVLPSHRTQSSKCPPRAASQTTVSARLSSI